MTGRVIVSSCGTSILSHSAPADMKSLLTDLANHRANELDAAVRKGLEIIASCARNRLDGADIKAARKLSAELNGILGIYRGAILSDAKRDQHFLLCTDTFVGQLAADLLKDWLEQHGLQVHVQPITDLRTRDYEEFTLGVHNLIKWCTEVCDSWRRANYKVIFNLVGGFKAVQGYMSALGMFFADESVYIFESSDQLMSIPRLPVQLDPNGQIVTHLTAFRLLALGEELTADQLTSISPTLVQVIDGKATLSVWGEVEWHRCKEHLYREKLLPSPTEKIRYSHRFEEEAAKYAKSNRMIQINDRIDDLTKYLLRNGAYNPRSLDFKQLRGKPFPPSTHECDAWSDGDARRILCHFDGAVLELDSLHPHL